MIRCFEGYVHHVMKSLPNVVCRQLPASYYYMPDLWEVPLVRVEGNKSEKKSNLII